MRAAEDQKIAPSLASWGCSGLRLPPFSICIKSNSNRCPKPLSPTAKPPSPYQQRQPAIGQQLGAQKLGYRLYALEPGMRGSPFHSHRVNEEMFYVVAGEGRGASRRRTFPDPRRRRDCLPAGRPGNGASDHQYQRGRTAISGGQHPATAGHLRIPGFGKYAVMDNFKVDAEGNASGFVAVARQWMGSITGMGNNTKRADRCIALWERAARDRRCHSKMIVTDTAAFASKLPPTVLNGDGYSSRASRSSNAAIRASSSSIRSTETPLPHHAPTGFRRAAIIASISAGSPSAWV